MASLEFTMTDDMGLGDLFETDFDELCEDMLKSSIGTLEESVKRECQRVISDPTAHELVDSCRAWKSPTHSKKADCWIWGIDFYGKPKKITYRKKSNSKKPSTVTNHDIAFWLEYGNRRQNAKPFITTAQKSVESQILTKMQEIYESKVGAR